MITTFRGGRALALSASLAGLLAGGAGCAAAQGDAELIGRGERAFFDKGCHGCHNVGKVGSPEVGADLSRIGAKYTRVQLAQWLQDPASQKPGAHMPPLALSGPEVQALAAYLATLR